uniref:V-type proton ATPase subunit F n=1 Tax=Chenopodium quinoa TaxID=63459 RepID=A0A803LFJ5_CHEQI
MSNKPQIPNKNSALIAVIADEDTITGFLLAGVGNVDIRRKTNYLIVDNMSPLPVHIGAAATTQPRPRRCCLSQGMEAGCFCPSQSTPWPRQGAWHED